MARVHPFQTNFTAGELTPKIAGQTDFKKYSNGVEILENLTVFPQGGASRRYGTRYVAPVKDASKTVRIIPFEFNVEQAYVLELGDQYIRFYKDGGAILEANVTVTGVTQANPAVVTATSHGYSNGNTVILSSVVGMTEINTDRYLVANQTTNTFELQKLDGTNLDSTSFTAYASGGVVNRVYEIVTTITEAMLYEIQFTQSADVMYIVHETMPPKKLSRTGHTSWTIVDEELKNGPFLDKNTGNRTLNCSATSIGTNRNLTANNADFKSDGGVNGWQAGDIGRQVRIGDGYGVITAITSTTVAKFEVKKVLTLNNSVNWYLGAYSDILGYPRTVSFYEQRLVFAGSTYYPQTIWASQSGLYTDFDVGESDAADAFIYTIAANKVNVIRWLSPARDLIVGTAGGEFKVGRPTGEPLKPDNVTITQQTTYGGWTTEPIQIGNIILFVQKQRKKIREFSYQFEDDGYAAPDMCLLSEHITGNGVFDVAYAQEPESIYWAVRDDGILLGMTYKREEDVVAWHRHIIGGQNRKFFNAATNVTNNTTDPLQNGFITITGHGYKTGDKVVYSANGNTRISGLQEGQEYFVVAKTVNEIELALTYEQAIDRTIVQIPLGTGIHTLSANSKVKSITSISEAEENQVWMVVERTVNNQVVKYVEYLDKTVNMDSALVGLVNGTSATISNLEHLEGESVQVLIGDAVYPNQIVTNGSISVSIPVGSGYKKIEIGMGYVSKLRTMRVEAGAQAGTPQARKKRYNEVTVRFLDTIGATINGDQIPFRTSATPMGQSIAPFSGDKRVTNLGWDREGQVTIEQRQPLPMTVLGVTGTLVTSD
jgi:hypothetical protein|tara:strand:+ start:7747 stop:10230 length:2484 start_codon:yes stop_codon:yes gene_type:complete